MKTLPLKYAGTCETCDAELAAGTVANWHGRGRITCTTCQPRQLTTEEYEARRQAKAERYQQYADNARSRSEQRYAAASRTAEMIPFGQPILVGHHSEGRHRRDISRIHANMSASVEESKKADYWERRAQAVTNSRAIHSDDPAAADKLRAKIAALEAAQERMKAINAAMKKAGLKKGEKITTEHLDRCPLELTEKERVSLLRSIRYSFDTTAIPSYALSNNSKEIRRLKQRLAEIER